MNEPNSLSQYGAHSLSEGLKVSLRQASSKRTCDIFWKINSERAILLLVDYKFQHKNFPIMVTRFQTLCLHNER